MLRNKYFLLYINKNNISIFQVMYYISHLLKEKKFRPVIFKEAESKKASYIVFETGHTFDPSKKQSIVYRSVFKNDHLQNFPRAICNACQ